MSSLQVTKTTNIEELLPFFNNDEVAKLFIKLFVPAHAAIFSINETSVSDYITTHHIAYDIMIAENYKNKTREMSHNDIHQDFTDFIIRTALFHRLVIENKSSDVLLKNIYMKWDTLSIESQNFYNENLELMDTKNNKVVIQSNNMDANIDYSNPDNYRVKLKKTNFGENCPNFMIYIPKIDKKIFNKIWFTDKDGKLTKYDESNKEYTNILKQLYCAVFNGDDKNNLPKTYDQKNKNKILNINIDKLIRRRLYNLHNVVSGKTTPPPPK